MVNSPRFRCATALFCCFFAVAAFAQEPTAPAPAPAPPNLAYVDGSVDVVQDGITERATPPVMLLAGDIVRSRDGRAEIVFGDGTLMHVSNDTEIEILGAEHLRLVSGRAILRVSHALAKAYVVDTPASSVRLETQGEYGITTDQSARLEVGVARGTATIRDPSPWTIRDGQMLTLAGVNGRPVIQPFNSARWDAFAQWSYERANGYATSTSAAQLPYELRPYAPVMEEYGRWDYVAPYGSVWFPSVAASWRPYYYGSWAYTRLGWTWHGHDRWAWPTHHYGRWGFNGNHWFWIPGKVWAPAWVSWGAAAGYVGWAPLGWDNRPAIGFWHRPDHPAYWPNYSPWRAWTLVPRRHFVPRGDVRANSIDGAQLDDNTRRAFAQAAPLLPAENVAVPRDSVYGQYGSSVPGYVRRPPRSYPSSGGADPYRGYATGPVGPAAATESGARTRRPENNPAYVPPRSWSSGDERRGTARDPGAARPTPQDQGGRGQGAVPRERSSGNSGKAQPNGRSGGQQPATPAPNGAVERGGGSKQGKSAGAPTGQGQQSGSQSGQGGARRRP
jgi:hypothetical protein